MGYYYAVAKGHMPGIYDRWDECREQVLYYPGNSYKKFETWDDANEFLKRHGAPHQATKRSKPMNDTFQYDQDGYVKVWVDGACTHNGYDDRAKAGIGVWFGHNHRLNFFGPVKGRQTSINAEIQAATMAIKLARSAGIENLVVITDSRFVFLCATRWIFRWRTNGWITADGRPVVNKISLAKLNQARYKLEHVYWNRVKAHSGDVGNDQADKLARRAIKQC